MYETEIVVYKDETGIVRSVGRGVGIAVESHQAACRGEHAEDCGTVPAAAESCVGIMSVGV
jgi:hypothetical protein